MTDTRASDSIRIVYDFPRNGWSIQQPECSMRDTGPNTAEEVEIWQEVYFAESWRFNP